MPIKPYRKQKRKKNEQNKTKNKLYLLKGSHLKHGAAGILKKLVTACLSSSLPVSHPELRFFSGRDALLLTPAHSLKKKEAIIMSMMMTVAIRTKVIIITITMTVTMAMTKAMTSNNSFLI